MKPQDQVSNLINCLTNDEDHRQELWVHYLSGNPIESFVSHLQKISDDSVDDIAIKRSLWVLIKEPLPTRLSTLLEKFTDFERSIMCLLMLGLTVSQISAYKGISEVRIRQTLSCIRYNNSWKEIYGTKEELNGRRKVRAERRRD